MNPQIDQIVMSFSIFVFVVSAGMVCATLQETNIKVVESIRQHQTITKAIGGIYYIATWIMCLGQ